MVAFCEPGCFDRPAIFVDWTRWAGNGSDTRKCLDSHKNRRILAPFQIVGSQADRTSSAQPAAFSAGQAEGTDRAWLIIYFSIESEILYQ